MLYENIADLAEKKGMSLSEVERKSNLSKGVISKWKKASPNLDSLSAVANTLGVTVNRLIR
ncbi:MAG: helix-turn-helix transcriptional regulator [Lachnospiraceae bacterium]|nr:helix-turn-helix transcriptional regulator [Lachnospiraceae bacterium]